MKLQLILYIFVIGLFSGCEKSQQPASTIQAPTPKPPRYAVQLLATPGMMSPVYCITDHDKNKLYMYYEGKEGLELIRTVDLLMAGQKTIP